MYCSGGQDTTTPAVTPVATTTTVVDTTTRQTTVTTDGQQRQILTFAPQDGTHLVVGQQFNVQLVYDTNPQNNALSGIGVQITMPAGVQFVDANVQFTNNIFGSKL